MKALRSTLLIISLVLLAVSSAGASILDNQNFEKVWPGSICVPDGMSSTVDYFSDGTLENEGSGVLSVHCGIEASVQLVSETKSCGAGCWDIDDTIIESPVDEVHVRVYDGNNNVIEGSSGITCDLQRRYWTRGTGATGFDESDSDSTGNTFTGYDTLRLLVSNGTWTSSTVYFYHIECELPGVDQTTSKVVALLSEWDGA